MASDETPEPEPRSDPKREPLGTDEEFYEEYIQPLVSQIVDLCEARGLPMAMGVQLLSLLPSKMPGVMPGPHEATIAISSYLPAEYQGPLRVALMLMTGEAKAIVGKAAADLQQELTALLAHSAGGAAKKKETIH